MFVYLSIPMFFSFLWLMEIRYNIKKTTILRYGTIYLFLISSFRSVSLGADSENYIEAFTIIGKRGTYYMEKGYVLLNKLVNFFTSNYSVLIFIINIVFFMSLYNYIRQFVKEQYLIYCLIVIAFHPYIFLQSTFNIIRQCCAVSLVIIGLYFYVNSIRFKQKYTGVFIFVFMVFLGAQFHRSSYFLLIIPFISTIKMNRSKWRILALIEVLY